MAKTLTIHIRQTTLAAAGGDAWWKGLSKEEQKAYIKEHPNSKYAQNHKRLAEEESPSKKKVGTAAPPVHQTKQNKTSPDSTFQSVKALFGEKLKGVPKEHAEFFENEQDKPGSEVRKSAGVFVHTHHKAIMDSIKGQVKEWGTGCQAIGKLATGKKISDHEKKALKALLIDAAVTAAVIGVTGGFSHGLALAVKHIGVDVLKDVVLKGVIKKSAHAMGTSMGHTAVLQALTYASADTPAEQEKILREMELSGWFDFLSKDKKEEYLEEHPTSKLNKDMIDRKQSGLTVKPMSPGSKKYGVFGKSGTCYLPNVSKEKAEQYSEKQNDSRKEAKSKGSTRNEPMRHTSSSSTTASSADKDAQNEKILKTLVLQLGKFIEKGDIPADAWEKAIDELAAKGKRNKKK